MAADQPAPSLTSKMELNRQRAFKTNSMVERWTAPHRLA